MALQDIVGHGLVHDAVGKPGSVLMTPISCLLPRSLNPTYASRKLFSAAFYALWTLTLNVVVAKSKDWALILCEQSI